jgi:hypothetical protein
MEKTADKHHDVCFSQNVREEGEKHTGYLVWKPERKRPRGSLGIHGKIIKKMPVDGRLQTGVMSLEIWTSGRLL